MPQPSPRRHRPVHLVVTAGSLPAGLTLNSSTGAITGTPTAAGFAELHRAGGRCGGSTASKALAIVIAALPSMENWTQGTHDAGHTGWAPGETVITTAKAASVQGMGDHRKGHRWRQALHHCEAADPLQTLALLVAPAGARSLQRADRPSAPLPPRSPPRRPRSLPTAGTTSWRSGKAAPTPIQWQTADTGPDQTLQTVSITGTMAVAQAAGGRSPTAPQRRFPDVSLLPSRRVTSNDILGSGKA